MNCYYCDKIFETDPDYISRVAEFDLGSSAPRCSWHWRYHRGHCGEPAHFISLAYCPEKEAFFCTGCAQDRKEVAAPLAS